MQLPDTLQKKAKLMPCQKSLLFSSYQSKNTTDHAHLIEKYKYPNLELNY